MPPKRTNKLKVTETGRVKLYQVETKKTRATTKKVVEEEVIESESEDEEAVNVKDCESNATNFNQIFLVQEPCI